MSTVVGIIDDGKVWMGADSFATTSDGERRRIICNKIFLNSPYLIGYIGSVRIGQMLNPHYFQAPENIMDLPDAIYNQLKEKEFLWIENNAKPIEIKMKNVNFLFDVYKRLKKNVSHKARYKCLKNCFTLLTEVDIKWFTRMLCRKIVVGKPIHEMIKKKDLEGEL